LRWPRDNLYPQKLALTSPTSGGRSVGKVRLRTKATEFNLRGIGEWQSVGNADQSLVSQAMSDRYLLSVVQPSACLSKCSTEFSPFVLGSVTEIVACVCFLLLWSDALHSNVWGEWRFFNYTYMNSDAYTYAYHSCNHGAEPFLRSS
jgi:hypothetical protein